MEREIEIERIFYISNIDRIMIKARKPHPYSRHELNASDPVNRGFNNFCSACRFNIVVGEDSMTVKHQGMNFEEPQKLSLTPRSSLFEPHLPGEGALGN